MSDNSYNAPPTVRVDIVDAETSYIGVARPGADESKPVWQIKKVITDGGMTTTLFANGKNYYLNIWDDRTTLSYS